MSTFTVTSDGQLEITASETSSHHDFDFMVGKWKIRNRKLKARLANCDDWVEFNATQDFRLVLNGFGNIDHFYTTVEGVPFEGLTMRLFDPRTRLWTIYWADSNLVKLDVGQVGSFDGPVGEFFARDVFNGQGIIVKFNWDATDPVLPVWSQAFSADEGKTWEWNWYMYFSRG